MCGSHSESGGFLVILLVIYTEFKASMATTALCSDIPSILFVLSGTIVCLLPLQ